LLGAVLVFYHGAILGDALSRVGNASYVEYSRDPHLAAIGFVWSPLPSAILLPFLPLRAWWPELVSKGFAANIESAAFMGITAATLTAILREIGVRRLWRWALVACFVAHPMIIYYGANGMTEAPMLCFLMLTCRSLQHWVKTGNTRRLAAAGGWCALGYLTRYEVLFAALGTVVLVAGWSFCRAPGRGWARRVRAFADVVVFAAPLAFAFIAWATVSWIIVGHPFEQFASQYGNSAQVALSAGSIHSTVLQAGGPLAYWARQTLALAPLLPVAVIWSIAFAIARRDARVLASIVVFGSTLLAQALLLERGQTFGWLRFTITAIPLLVLCSGAIAGTPTIASTSAPKSFRRAAVRARYEVWAILAAILAVVMAATAVPVAAEAMTNPLLAREEAPIVRTLFFGEQWNALNRFAPEAEIARRLDAMHLPDGAVLVDVAFGFGIVLASDNPRQFIITTDRDFEQSVADPALFGVKYLLVLPDSGFAANDALNRAHRNLYTKGAGIATLVTTFDGQGLAPNWRLYRVTKPRPSRSTRGKRTRRRIIDAVPRPPRH
jgi:hypothetical protein